MTETHFPRRTLSRLERCRGAVPSRALYPFKSGIHCINIAFSRWLAGSKSLRIRTSREQEVFRPNLTKKYDWENLYRLNQVLFSFLIIYLCLVLTERLLASVDEWLALLRHQLRCLDSVRGSWFKSTINCRGQPRKITEIVGIWPDGLYLASHGAAALKIYLASDLTNCASGGSSSNTPSRKVCEVKVGLNHGYIL